MKNRVLLENYYLPGDLERQIGAFVDYYNNQRYQESLKNVTPADVYRTLSDLLVWVLHAAYAFIPLGAFALGLDQFLGNPGTAGAQHLWMSGAIGAMTLAIMARATLGHTGQSLTANRAIVLTYVCVFVAAFARLCAPIWVEASYLAGVLWIAAFVGFVATYGPSLMFTASGKRNDVGRIRGRLCCTFVGGLIILAIAG